MIREVKPIDILLVDDNPGDVLLAEEAMKESKIRNNLHTVRDGVEAMKFLRGIGQYSNEVRPDLVILDLNLPKKSGLEVLMEMKADDTLKRIPVVMLTISKSESDILNAYNSHVNCYITKPIDLEQFMTVVRSIENFWLQIVKLPPL